MAHAPAQAPLLGEQPDISMLQRSFTELSTQFGRFNNIPALASGDRIISELTAAIERIKAELKADIADIRTDIERFKMELKTDIERVKTELKTDIEDTKTELTDQISALQEGRHGPACQRWRPMTRPG